MTDQYEPRTLFITVTLRRPDGHITVYTEAHRTGTRDERGDIVVAFSPDFPALRADELVKETGYELVDYDGDEMTDAAIRAELDTLDLY